MLANFGRNLLILSCLLGNYSLALAVETSTKMNTPSVVDEADFFKTVNETGGYITPTLHREFWDMMRIKYDERQRTKIVADIQNSLDVLKAFQAHTWESARISFFDKQIKKTNQYDVLKNQVLAQHSPYFSSQSIIDYSDNILRAAASRASLEQNGNKIYITPELIEENKIGLQGSYERLKLLWNPLWNDQLKEFRLQHIPVSLLSLYAPDQYQEHSQHNDEKIDIHMAQLNVDPHSTYEIGAINYQKGDKKFNTFTPQEKAIYCQEFIKEQFTSQRLHDPLLSMGNWRNYSFAKGIGSNENQHIIMMSFFVGDKAVYVKLLTDNNLALANAEFNEFTKRLQIIEPTL